MEDSSKTTELCGDLDKQFLVLLDYVKWIDSKRRAEIGERICSVHLR